MRRHERRRVADRERDAGRTTCRPHRSGTASSRALGPSVWARCTARRERSGGTGRPSSTCSPFLSHVTDPPSRPARTPCAGSSRRAAHLRAAEAHRHARSFRARRSDRAVPGGWGLGARGSGHGTGGSGLGAGHRTRAGRAHAVPVPVSRRHAVRGMLDASARRRASTR